MKLSLWSPFEISYSSIVESAFYWGHRDNKILGNGESLNIILGNVLFDSYHWGRVFILLHTLGLERLYLFNLIVVIGAGYLFYYIFWDWKDLGHIISLTLQHRIRLQKQ